MLWIVMSSVTISLYYLVIRWRLLRLRTSSRYLSLTNWRRSCRRLLDPLRRVLVRLWRLARETLTADAPPRGLSSWSDRLYEAA